MRLFLLLLLAINARPSPGAEALWWRGNTHTHTVLCGHADSTPDAVTKWYHDQGYQFLCLSEHDQFIDPKNVTLPEPQRQDFLLVPGIEISTLGNTHMTSLNVEKVVTYAGTTAADIFQSGIDNTRAADGAPIINHPNFGWGMTAADLGALKRVHLFELYNGHPWVHNEGDHDHPSTEVMWDTVLTGGMAVYAVASDDAHNFQGDWKPEASNAGRGWVMVRSEKLEAKALCQAMERGDFYASSGVFLADARADAKSYSVEIDSRATEAEIAKDFLTPIPLTGAAAAAIQPGYLIEFIGPNGRVVKSVAGESGACDRDRSLPYLRARATLSVKKGDAVLQYRAWCQPVFNDGRLATVEIEGARTSWAAE